jgi:dipeptidyl aminopeptidase/acylaminoacyl peptidase
MKKKIKTLFIHSFVQTNCFIYSACDSWDLHNYFLELLIIMKQLSRTLIGLTAILCCLIGINTATAKPLLKDYGTLAEIQLISISPSGNLMAFRKVTTEYDRIVVYSLAAHKQVTAIDVAKIKPNNLYFLNEDQLVFIASETQKIEGFIGKIDLSSAFLFDLKGKPIRQLLVPGDGPIYKGQSGLGRVIGLSPDGKYAFMPAYIGEESSEAPNFGLLKVNLTEKRTPTVLNKGTKDTDDFFMDNQGNLLAQESYNENSNTHKIRARKNDEWVDIFKDTTEIKEKGFVGLTPDYKSLVMLETNADTGRTAYYTMRLADGTISGPIFGRDDADIDLVVTNFQRVVLGVRYSGLRPSYQFFDAQLNQRMKDIAASFPDQSVYLSDFSPDWKNLLIFVEGSDAPSDYYLFTEGKAAQYLTSSRPQIHAEDLHPLGTVTFIARDGLKIPTILTIPKDKVDAMKNLPTVIMPHGGPAAHDTIGFDWMAQALANSGYLVMQPQFRGSDGFGLKHELAGRGEWGKKMQDDLTDTVAFAIKKGLADPSKICVVGASYGGYAALAGGAFTPDLYKCIVSIAGISDLKTMLNWDKKEQGKNSWVVTYMEQQFSNGEADTQAMAAVSPVYFAEKFKAPVLLIHGADDKRVPFTESEQMKKALKKAKKDVTLVELKGEDHFLSQSSTRLLALDEMVKFVNLHIGSEKLN